MKLKTLLLPALIAVAASAASAAEDLAYNPVEKAAFEAFMNVEWAGFVNGAKGMMFVGYDEKRNGKVVEATPAQLADDLTANPIRYGNSYTGKRVYLRGCTVFQMKDYGTKGAVVACEPAGKAKLPAILRFEPYTRNHVAAFEVGKPVNVRCIGSGDVQGNPALLGCSDPSQMDQAAYMDDFRRELLRDRKSNYALEMAKGIVKFTQNMTPEEQDACLKDCNALMAKSFREIYSRIAIISPRLKQLGF